MEALVVLWRHNVPKTATVEKPRIWLEPGGKRWLCGAVTGNEFAHATPGPTPSEARALWNKYIEALTASGMRWEVFP